MFRLLENSKKVSIRIRNLNYSNKKRRRKVLFNNRISKHIVYTRELQGSTIANLFGIIDIDSFGKSVFDLQFTSYKELLQACFFVYKFYKFLNPKTILKFSWPNFRFFVSSSIFLSPSPSSQSFLLQVSCYCPIHLLLVLSSSSS